MDLSPLSRRIVTYIKKSVCPDLNMRCAAAVLSSIELFDGRVHIAIAHFHGTVASWTMNTWLPKSGCKGTTFAEFVVAIREYMDNLQEGPMRAVTTHTGRHVGKSAFGLQYALWQYSGNIISVPEMPREETPTVKKRAPKPEPKKAKGYQPPALYAARSARGGFRPEHRRL
jgi:hypothetical protein